MVSFRVRRHGRHIVLVAKPCSRNPYIRTLLILKANIGARVWKLTYPVRSFCLFICAPSLNSVLSSLQALSCLLVNFQETVRLIVYISLMSVLLQVQAPAVNARVIRLFVV